MQHMTRVSFALAALCAALVSAGCGGGNASSSGTPTAAATAAAPAATTEAQREKASLPMTQAAAVPADLKCADEIVWVNLSSKAYHEAADPYYGRTKHGNYLCKADAVAAGYHKAGAQHSHKRGSTPGGSMNSGAGAMSTSTP